MARAAAAEHTSPLDYYARPGIMTDPGRYSYLFSDLPRSIAGLCRVAQGLLMHPLAGHIYGVKPTSESKNALEMRPISAMLAAIHERDARPLTVAREPKERIIGNCRDFAVTTCAMLRYQAVPARVRVGFAAYFGPAMNYDHWLCEYWNESERRWVLVDAQLDDAQRQDSKITFDPLDVPRDKFIIAGRAWQLCREGRESPRRFGFNAKLRGMPFIRGSLVQDLLSLNKIEALPLREWQDIVGKDNLSSEELSYCDHIAALALSVNELFHEVRAAHETSIY